MKPAKLLLLLMTLTTSSFGQMGFGKIEEVKEIKQRSLIFLMEEEDPDKIKKLAKKPDELQLYKSEIRRINDAMKVAAGYWTYSTTPVEFKTRTAILALQDTKKNKHAVISFTRYQVENWHTKSNYERGSNPLYVGGGSQAVTNSYWVRERYMSSAKDLSAVYIDLIEGFEKGRAIYLQNMPNLFPTQGDLIFGVQMLETYLKGRLAGKSMGEAKEAMKEYANVLKTKILLIDHEDVNKSLTESEITKYYTYPFLLTDYVTIEKAIIEKDPRYAYIEIVPMGVSGFYHLVVDAEKGVCIGYSAPFPIGGSGERVTGRHLKNYTGFVEK